MKKILSFLLIIEAILAGFALYFEQIDTRPDLAQKFWGFFTLIMFLIIMPLFLWWRYKDKDLSSFYYQRNEEED